MVKVVQIATPGGPEALQVGDMPLPPLGPKDALVRQQAVGVNFIDVYLRTGLYPLPRLPGVIGVEAAGVVEQVGPEVTELAPGDRVAYAGPPVGSYAEARVFPAERLLKIPDNVATETASASMLRGLTVHMLLNKVHAAEPGDWLLIHAAAGGLGQMLTRWATSLGARVIATVDQPHKMRIAEAAGAEAVLLHDEADLAGKVRQLTGGDGVHAAYDGVGAGTLARTLDCVRPFGVLVSLGQAGGPIPPVNVEDFGPGRSISLSRPSVMRYALDLASYRAGGAQVLEQLSQGFSAPIGGVLPLEQAAEAHRLLERGAAGGSLVLRP